MATNRNTARPTANRAARRQDSPKIHANIKRLGAGTTDEPFVYMTKANHRVVFPDPMGLDALESERFLNELENSPNSVVLKEWLSAEDYAALAEEHLTLRQLNTLMEVVQDYYNKANGVAAS